MTDTGPGMLTAAQAAAERGISPSRMRDLIAAHGIEAQSRQIGRAGANLYPADQIRAIPAGAQGVRHDLTGQLIGRMFATARIVAEARGARDEYDKILVRCLDGNPAAVQMLTAATRRWTKRRPVPAAAAEAVRDVEQLAAQIGDLPKHLPVSMRSRIVISESQSRRGRQT